ncbi:uncharacterized protein [Nothobranchius furzeri]|uniref:uncharacterized protein n=1 Tax=Nothobranchius furzeri TaxID=105023 RepID=UPI003904DFAD
MNKICGSGSTYDKAYCENIANVFNDKYLLNMTNRPECINCDNPIKGPDETLTLNTSVESIIGNTPGEVDASSAATFVANLANLVSQMNGTSAELSAGEGVKGMLVRQADPTVLEPVSLAYQSANSNLNIIGDAQTLSTFSRSVTVSKEAFQQAMSSNISIPFAAIIRFLNMTSDDKNSTVLQNEVIGIDMGAKIKNLSDPVNITFKNLIYSGNPHCHSWNGDGNSGHFVICMFMLEGSTAARLSTILTEDIKTMNEHMRSYVLNPESHPFALITALHALGLLLMSFKRKSPEMGFLK